MSVLISNIQICFSQLIKSIWYIWDEVYKNEPSKIVEDSLKIFEEVWPA